jgi:hypothetical protein
LKSKFIKKNSQGLQNENQPLPENRTRIDSNEQGAGVGGEPDWVGARLSMSKKGAWEGHLGNSHGYGHEGGMMGHDFPFLFFNLVLIILLI